MLHSPGAAAQKAYSFNVLNQRSIALTAQYWNPILTHVSKKSGVPLELKLAKTAQEGNAIGEKFGYDFLYTNHFFTPERDRLGYKVIARPAGPGIRSQIVVPQDSPIQSLHDLNGKDVAFVTPDAFHRLLAADGRAAQGQGERQCRVHRQPGSLVRAAAGQQGRGRRRQQLGHGALRAPRVVQLPRAVDFGGLPGPVHHGESQGAGGQGRRGQGGA